PVRSSVLASLTLLIALIAGGAGWQAWQLDADLDDTAPAAAATSTPPATARTPVLSARRVPRWLQAPVADAALTAQLQEIVAASPPDTCLSVRRDGHVVFEHAGDTPLVPASTTKIVTGVAALQVPGPDTRFRTTVVAADAPADGVVTGDVWLVGGGDPVLATDDYIARYDEPQLHSDLEALADAVVAAGVQRIAGGIVGDESRYDTKRIVESWDPVFVRDHESGPLSALSVNDGFSSFPPTRSNLAAVPADEPATHAAQVCTDLLVARGVTVAGAPRTGAAPSGAVEVAAITSERMTRWSVRCSPRPTTPPRSC